jgi:hypothetical protein
MGVFIIALTLKLFRIIGVHNKGMKVEHLVNPSTRSAFKYGGRKGRLWLVKGSLTVNSWLNKMDRYGKDT